MRRTFALVFYNFVLVCAAFIAAEYAARRITHVPNSQPEFLLDRWAAYRNNPAFERAGVHHTREGFRRDRPVSLDKPPNTIRIFLMGGSVVYGGETLYPEIENRWRLDNHQTIDYYLEQKLNAAFPEKHWEVINAAVKGYLLNQDLARLLSVVLRYQPDRVILLDGENDLSNLLRTAEQFDPYGRAAMLDEFNHLTNPRSVRSLGVMLSTWLANNSVLYRSIRDEAMRLRVQRSRKRKDVVTNENQYRMAADQLYTYLHFVRQIHQILALDGIPDTFALQPELLLTRKPLADSEARLVEYHRVMMGPLFVHGFEALYPELARQLESDAPKQGYRFLDLTGVFDQMGAQVFTDNCHLTPDGNRAVADRIFDSLR